MSPESIERIRQYVSGTRREDVASARNSRDNGYKSIAMEHENRVALADQILKDLAEFGGQNAV